MDSKFDYILPLGNSIEYAKIEGYRVIFECFHEILPEVYCFDNINEAKLFSETIQNVKYIKINAVLFHEGLYLQDEKGKYIDTIHNQRYSYKKISIFSEVPLKELEKKYYISIY